jgi:hypothetical protein
MAAWRGIAGDYATRPCSGARRESDYPVQVQALGARDRHLRQSRPFCPWDFDVDDVRHLGQQGGLLGDGRLEVVRCHVGGPCGCVAKRFQEDVLVRIIDTARPLEPEVAGLLPGGGREWSHLFHPALGVRRLHREFDDDEDHRVLTLLGGRLATIIGG